MGGLNVSEALAQVQRSLEDADFDLGRAPAGTINDAVTHLQLAVTMLRAVVYQLALNSGELK